MTYDSRYTPINLKDSNLFHPVKVGNMTLEHRVVMAPLTRLRAHADQTPNKDNLAEEYYDQRSQAKGTLIVTEGAFVSPQAGGMPNAPGVYTEKQFENWKPIFERIHKNESYVYVQLWNLGRQAYPGILKAQGLKFLGASDGVYMDETSEKSAIECGNELKGCTKQEIAEFVEAYVKSAKGSIEAGADGVEIHSANGYLLNQFLDPISNKRTDEYGGSIENRSRFVLEVVDAVVAAVGASKVGIRFSPYGVFGSMSGSSDPLIIAQFSHVIGELEKRAKENPEKRLAYIHLMEPRMADPTIEDLQETDASNDFVSSIWKGIIIKSGNYGLENEAALADVNANDRTLLAYGRYFISNPDLVNRLKSGAPLNAYDRSTFYTNDAKGYTDYPTYTE